MGVDKRTGERSPTTTNIVPRVSYFQPGETTNMRTQLVGRERGTNNDKLTRIYCVLTVTVTGPGNGGQGDWSIPVEVAVGRGAAIRIGEWEHAKDQVSGERNDARRRRGFLSGRCVRVPR